MPLAGRQESDILDIRRRKHLGKLREEENEKEEPATEQRKECIDLGSDLGERKSM